LGSVLPSVRQLAARLATAALAVPLLAGGAPAIVTHAMVPAMDGYTEYEPLGEVDQSGEVHFSCQMSTPATCFGPEQIRAAYGIQPVLDAGFRGTGRTIVIIDAYQSPTIRQDLAAFDDLWHLPAPPSFEIWPDHPTPYDPSNPSHVTWSREISIDVQWAHAMAPAAAIKLVLSATSDDTDMLSATRYAIENNLGDVISQSFGEAEKCATDDFIAEERALFEAAADRGITLVAAAGDTGAARPECNGQGLVFGPSTPASDPGVIAVGGTRLRADGTLGTWASEVGWNRSGGGFSAIYRRPGYQAPFQPNNKARGVPDVSYVADINSSVIVRWNGMNMRAGGTSVGTPQWAAIVALADEMAGRRLGDVNKILYHIGKSADYGSAFHDMTVGNNSITTITGYAAATGWDPITGLGTPNAANLIPLLAGRPGLLP
jgi:subtilase family serine protease